MSTGRPKIHTPLRQRLGRVDILQGLHLRLSSGSEGFSRVLVYGVPGGYGGLEFPVAVGIAHFSGKESLAQVDRSLPYGLSLLGVMEWDRREDLDDIYAYLDQVDQPFQLIQRGDEPLRCLNGADFLDPVEINIIPDADFWDKVVTTFRIRGNLFLTSFLEEPELKRAFATAKTCVLEQAVYSFGNNEVLIAPPEGKWVADSSSKGLAKGGTEELKKFGNKNPNQAVNHPPCNLVNVQVLFDNTRSSLENHSLVIVAEKVTSCKYFENYLDLDTLLIVPNTCPNSQLYEHFSLAVCAQLETGFRHCIDLQLINSIAADKPIVHHFWPEFARHFISVLYPQNTCLEKLKDIRLELHELYFAHEKKPYFRQTAALFQDLVGLVSPHLSLKPKFETSALVQGSYEYRHYMQEGFNDDGWGCAYRSLQTIVSWFRLQGFTSRSVPTHREIQECLVSLGDKPQSFIGSKQWIGSTEVSFVLEAMLGISCRILSMSSGGEMASKILDIQSHFRCYGTPIMVGGGVLAHTIIGAECDDAETVANFLVLDPHYTGKDDLKTILAKGWVGWKDSNFWSKKDFYNLCMPLVPSSI